MDKEIKDLIYVRRNTEVALSIEEEWQVILKWKRKYPEALKRVLEVKRIKCPFPVECDRFPCKTLYCNADVLDNGYAYRMS